MRIATALIVRAVVQYDPARVTAARLAVVIEATLPHKARVVEGEGR